MFVYRGRDAVFKPLRGLLGEYVPQSFWKNNGQDFPR